MDDIDYDENYLSDLPLWADDNARNILQKVCDKHKVPIEVLTELVNALIADALQSENEKNRLRGEQQSLVDRITSAGGGGGDIASLDVPRHPSTWQQVTFAKLREWVASTTSDNDQLIVFPGVDVLGNPYSFDLAAAPHLLVGGTTGSGKSVCIHALILSMLLQLPPTALKLALIDPKQVEFSVYKGWFGRHAGKGKAWWSGRSGTWC